MNLIKRYHKYKKVSQFYSQHKIFKKTFRTDTLVLTVAFNKPNLIKQQYKLLKKYVQDDFEYVVIDNSTVSDASNTIQIFCKKNKIVYYRLLNNPAPEHPSQSHGYALNWSVKNLLNNKVKNLAYLDHDIFPYKKYSFSSAIAKQPFYGVRQTKNKAWYLWPGFCIFNLDKVEIKKINFLPMPGLDTGGSMWPDIYKKHNLRKLKFAKVENNFIGKGKNKQKNGYQIVDNAWVHLINGSNWAKVGNMSEKEKILKNINSLNKN